MIIPNQGKLIAPRINFDEIVEWNQTTLEQMIYAISKEEGFDNPKLLIALARHESIFLKVPKILDTNGKWSLGLYHWQRNSFDDYCIEKYNLSDDIMNPVIQTRCSIRAIKDGHLKDLWHNSAKKIAKGL
ncbi:MAG: hypothetical protein PHV11_09755 [Candidatus Bipolaricaulis sp.]|nr:hypothetical protein [Candidatus Bipolaricaulis sp.]